MADTTHNTFLANVAKDIKMEFEGNYTSCSLIFTNKRANTFFNEALYEQENKPFISPSFFTIDDFVQQRTNLSKADDILLISYLYETYCSVYYDKYNPCPKEEQETFEHFFYWGRMLLADFDDIDKNLASAHDVFSIIKDIKDIEEKFDFLSPEQKEVLHKFFGKNFNGSLTQLQKNFISVWACLEQIYNEYKEKLTQKRLAYSGMIYRSVYENLQKEEQDDKKVYCVVGFNVLNKVEQGIFLWLKKNCNTRFYWDYDDFFLQDKQHEAGLFMRENLLKFPSPESFQPQRNLIRENNVKINVVSSPSENQQVAYISYWLSDLLMQAKVKHELLQQRDIAIVLCNEALLPSVINALPEEFDGQKTNVNITMGCAFSEMPLFDLIDSYLKYQKSLTNNSSVRVASLMPFLTNNYVKNIFKDYSDKIKDLQYISLTDDEKEEKLFTKKKTPKQIIEALQTIIEEVVKANNNIDEESTYRLWQTLENLNTLFSTNPQLVVSDTLLYSTFRKAFSSIKIPFISDQLNGIQIMGLLESRSLDFKHILFLSANDDMLPKTSSDSSFIPYSIRKTYDLTTVDRKIAVFAYYFYRLLERAESFDCVYNSTATETKPKEMSRFLLQLKLESNKEMNELSLPTTVSMSSKDDMSVIKRQKELDLILWKGINRYFSPSYLNNFFTCEYKFYLQNLCRIQRPEQESDDLQGNDFGTIFHNTMKEIYDGIISKKQGDKTITSSDIEVSNTFINQLVQKNFNSVVFPNQKREPAYTQKQKIYIDELKTYVVNMLSIDAAYAPFTMVAQELEVKKQINISGHKVNIGGKIDRIDMKGNVLRVVDYKTSGKEKPPIEKENLFFVNYAEDNNETRNDYIAQILIYCWLLKDNRELPKELTALNFEKLQIKPYILYIRTQKIHSNLTYDTVSSIGEVTLKGDSSPIKEYYELHKEIEASLISGLEKLLSQQEGQECKRHKNQDNCQYCDYKDLCNVDYEIQK